MFFNNGYGIDYRLVKFDRVKGDKYFDTKKNIKMNGQSDGLKTKQSLNATEFRDGQVNGGWRFQFW